MLFAVVVMSLTSCSSDDSSSTDNNNNNGGISNNPVSGTLYGDDFTIGGGYARMQTINEVESFTLYMTDENLDCDDAFSGDFPIVVRTPSAIATHTTGAAISFNDPGSDDFISVGSGVTVIITEVTDTMVKGKVKGASTSTDNDINGTFSLPICE